MTRIVKSSLAIAVIATCLTILVVIGTPNDVRATADNADTIRDLSRRIEDLERRLARQEDIDAVRRIAYAYGYFMDNALTDEVKAMFADDMEYCEVSGYGLYKGRKGCDTMWTSVIGVSLQDENSHLAFGRLVKHYLVKDIIDVAPDGKTAEGRFDYIGFAGVFGYPKYTRHQVGVYRLGFIKENGVWKIRRFSLVFDAIDYNFDEWATQPRLRCPPNNVPPPDAPYSYYHPFPETGVIPFHFVNPVSGKPIREYVNPTRYWQGNWPGEFNKGCGVRPDAPTKATPVHPKHSNTLSPR